MRRATLVNLRKNEALTISLVNGGKPHSVMMTPGDSVNAIADSFSTVQIGSLVARGWMKVLEETEVIEHPIDSV
jgi:hypothetical protein